MSTSSPRNVCVPMKINAFRLNPAACGGPARLAPISQPDYSHLRLDEFLRHDIQEDVDLHDTSYGSKFSDRVTDLATGELKRHRLGIYLHWLIPRFYRTGLAATESSEKDAPGLRDKRGYQSVDSEAGPVDPQNPTYRPLPTRWIILRHLLAKTPLDANIPEFEAFVIESDRLRKMEDLGPEVDAQVDVSPFVHVGHGRDSVDFQAETFIGFKQPLDNWTESVSDQNILRVPLSVLSSVNPLFTEYQPHNTNVFSMIDNFSFVDANGKTAYLQTAKANYYVIGWHPNAIDDPFHLFNQEKPYPTHGERLDACFMHLADGSSGSITEWTESPLLSDDPTRTIAHGAIYEVMWDLDSKPTTVLADDIAKSYHDFSPISVGVNPVDALLAVAHTHALAIDSEKKSTDTETPKPDPLAQDILSLQTLVANHQEDPDSQLQTADALYTSFFTPSEGGQRWHISGSATKTGAVEPSVPSARERSDLQEVNDYQAAVDLCTREIKWLEWEMWAEWWKWVSSQRHRNEDEEQAVRDKINDMVYRHQRLREQSRGWKDYISQTAKQYNWESVTAPRYYNARDPAMLLCGMKSGWPIDFAGLLRIRLDSQIVDMTNIYDADPDGWSNVQNSLSAISQKLPIALQATAKALLAEFYVLRPVPQDTPHLRSSPANDLAYPLYHDQGPEDEKSADGDQPWRDRWNGTQPWFPLFAEWEIEYFHVNADSWILAPRDIPYAPPKLFPKVKDGMDIGNTQNKRNITGRSLVLPQTTTMLKNTVEQLLKNKSTAQQSIDAIHAAINKLDFLSISISGVCDQLSTRYRGSHLSPTTYQPGFGLQPLSEAVDASRGVIDENAIRLMHSTTMTPFGDFPSFENAAYPPFKPVTHGQFRFTKLNIVDMFGQVICAIDPDDKSASLHPYISEFYACSVDNSNPPVPQAVVSDVGQCMQLGPSINQDSRLNAHCVKWDEQNSGWVPVTEYDNPIWGWLVVNYIDNGLQVFLPDGTFYREIRLGGPDGTSSGIRAWLPFKAPENHDSVPRQLRALMGKLTQAEYLQEFFDVMIGALGATMHTPNHYAGYLPAITGRPFALINTGWSLELSQPPHVNQSTSVPNALPETDLESYGFQVKFGDKDRTFDGLLGYFSEKSTMDFDLDNFYTYFPGNGTDTCMTTLIEPDNYPILTPYYNMAGLSAGDSNYVVKTPSQITKEYNERLTVFGMLVDPFATIHAYTSFQPVSVLQLPQWALEQALKNITAFFHLGPIVMPYDVPEYDSARSLTSSSGLVDIQEPPKDTPGIPIPSIGVAEWAWLQPYLVAPATLDSIVFNPLSLAAINNQPKLEETPYTAVEGYLYLKKPIVSPAADQA